MGARALLAWLLAAAAASWRADGARPGAPADPRRIYFEHTPPPSMSGLHSVAAGARGLATSAMVCLPSAAPGGGALGRKGLEPPGPSCDEFTVRYNAIVRTGAVVGGATFGEVLDEAGGPVWGTTRAGELDEDAPQSWGQEDFTSLIQIEGRLFSVVHIESFPGAMYLLELEQNDLGHLFVGSVRPIDWSASGGVCGPCAGSISPWNSHLGGEECPMDAKHASDVFSEWSHACTNQHSSVNLPDGNIRHVTDCAGWPGDLDDDLMAQVNMTSYVNGSDPGLRPARLDFATFQQLARPYHYGYPMEVTVSKEGAVLAVKHYAMGRTAVETALVMPDNRTVYIADDLGTNGVLTRFVAARRGDLSEGELFAARLAPRAEAWVPPDPSARGGGAFDLEWLPLGSATSAEVRAAIDAGTTFTDLFEVGEAVLNDDNRTVTCPEGLRPINAGYAGPECLRVREGMELLASRLETRRYAALRGATTELSKLEGLAWDPARASVFAAVSSVRKSMEGFAKYGEPDPKYDAGGADMVALEYNPCGCIYRMPVDEGYKGVALEAVLCGRPAAPGPGGTPPPDGLCDVGTIAGPDNLAMMGAGALLIAEDTDHHASNVLWALNLDVALGPGPRGGGAAAPVPGEAAAEGVAPGLTRVLTVPPGAEVTGIQWYPDLLGQSYLVAVVQHPYSELTGGEVEEGPSTGKASWVGYLGPLPGLSGEPGPAPPPAPAPAPGGGRR